MKPVTCKVSICCNIKLNFEFCHDPIDLCIHMEKERTRCGKMPAHLLRPKMGIESWNKAKIILYSKTTWLWGYCTAAFFNNARLWAGTEFCLYVYTKIAMLKHRLKRSIFYILKVQVVAGPGGKRTSKISALDVFWMPFEMGSMTKVNIN